VNPDGSPIGGLFASDQFVEDRQNLLAVQESPLQFLPHRLLIAVAKHQLVQEFPGNVDIPAQSFSRVSPEEQPVEQGCLALRSQRIEFFQLRRHRHKKRIIVVTRVLRKTPRLLSIPRRPKRANLTQGLCHYFTLGARLVLSWCGFGEDETISRNNETISNPAITAPINIGDPISANYSLLFSKHAACHLNT